MSTVISVAILGHRHSPARNDIQAQQHDAPATRAPAGATPASSAAGDPAAGLLAMLNATSPAPSPAEDTPAIKPNIDALKRVLAHYSAQSAAMETTVSLLKA